MGSIGLENVIQVDVVQLLLLAGIGVATLLSGWLGLRMVQELRRGWRGTALPTYAWIVEALRSPNPLMRRMAVGHLASQREEDGDVRVILALMRAVKDPDDDVRAAALEALLPLAGKDPTVGSLLARVARTDHSAMLRLRAVHGMAQLAPLPPSAVTALLHALQHDSSTEVRLQAAYVLEQQAAADTIPVAPLISALGDENPAVCQAVAAVLERWARSRPDVLPALTRVIRRGSQGTRLQAMSIVQTLGIPTPETLDACLLVLWNEEEALYTQAITTLAHLARQDPATLAHLAKAARSSDDHLRRLRLLAVLRKVGQGTAEVVATLLEALTDIDGRLSEAAQETLRALDFQDSEAVRLLLEGLLGEAGPQLQKTLQRIHPTPILLQELQEALSAGIPEMRQAAATILVAWAPTAPEVIDYLLSALQDPASRDGVRDVLAELAHSDEALLARIAADLHHDDPHMRQETVALLEHLGQQGLAVTASLLRALEDPEVRVREGAMDALLVLHPDGETLAQVLLDLLPVAESRAREGAIELLTELARRSATALELLEAALQHPRAAVREGVVKALGQVGDAESVSILTEALGDARSQVRLQAVRALAPLALEFPQARHALEQALEDRSGYVREAALRAWVEANEAAPHLLDRLIQALNDESALVRKATTWALGRWGRADDENLVDTLARALQDRDEEVRRTAAAAFDQVMNTATPADLPHLRSQLEPFLSSRTPLWPSQDAKPLTLGEFVEDHLERLRRHSPSTPSPWSKNPVE